MDPFRPLVIDNRMPRAQFLDGNPMTDGLANLFASAINAPIAASQIRRQREADDRQTMLQDQALQRQAMLDQRAQDWRDQDVQRMAERDAMAKLWQEAQIGNMQADNARQLAAMFGNGLNNVAARGIDAVKALRGLFAGWGRGAGASAQAKPAKPIINDFGNKDAPDWRQWNGQAWVPVLPPAAAEAAPGQPVANTGWPLLPTLGAGAALAGGAMYAGKKLLGRGAPAAAAPAAGAASKAGTLGRLWNGARVAGRAMAPLAAAAGAASSIYDATQAENGGDVAANLAGAGGYAGLGGVALAKGLGAAMPGAALATLPVGMITGTIQQELGGSHDPGAAAILKAYATGELRPRLGMWSRGMGILANGDSQFPDQIQQQRVQQILHAVNVALPTAADQQQQAKRQMLLGRIEQAAWSDDPSELQAQLGALFPSLLAPAG